MVGSIQRNFASLCKVWLCWFFLRRGSTIWEIYLHGRIKVTTNLVQSCDNLHRAFRKLILFSPILLATHKDGHVATPEHEKECVGETLIILHKVIALYMCPAGAFLWSQPGSGLGTCRTMTKGPVPQGESATALGLPGNIQHFQRFPSLSCWVAVTDLCLQGKIRIMVLWLPFPVSVAGPYLLEHPGFPYCEQGTRYLCPLTISCRERTPSWARHCWTLAGRVKFPQDCVPVTLHLLSTDLSLS